MVRQLKLCGWLWDGYHLIIAFRDEDKAKCDKIDNKGDTCLPGYSPYDREE